MCRSPVMQALLRPNSLGRLSPRAGAYLVALFAVLTYAMEYWQPAGFFWDENYHVAAAQKYLNGVYFMEPHPPLGKLLIAAGEEILQANEQQDDFTGTTYARDPSPGFSFAGYRLFPVVFAIFSALLLYELARRLIGRSDWAILVTSFYVFDTALIVHSRGAMLEGPQICFVLAALLSGTALCQAGSRKAQIRWAVLLGSSFAAAMATKVTSLFIVCCAPVVLWCLWRKGAALLGPVVTALSAAFLVYAAIWQAHFLLGTTINPSLDDQGFYSTNRDIRQLITDGASSKIENLPTMFLAAQDFFKRYQGGVPLLNLCKNDENGSPPYFWPFGARSINYRWELVDGGMGTRFLYLQANPIVWLCSLVGVLGAAAVLFGCIFFGLWNKLQRRGAITSIFLLYVCYMLPMLFITRVMYLYHYFIPLILGMLLFGLVLSEVSRIGPFQFTPSRKTTLLKLVSLAVICSFIYFSPLAYYQPLSDLEIESRAWIKLWDLRCANCSRTTLLAFPLANQ